MTIIEAMEYGRSLPQSLWLNRYGRRLMSREEWEQLPRWRRVLDQLFGCPPPKVELRPFR